MLLASAVTYSHWWPAGSDYGISYDDNFNQDWQYPGNGVTMADGWIVASYNALNQPIAIWSFNYQGTPNLMWFGYDPLGRCVKRWVSDSGDVYSNPATYYHYDGWNMLQEGNNAWGPARVYAHGSRVDEIVWSSNTFTGEQAYHHYDARNHCTLLTDSAGAILEQYEYDAFGEPYFYDAAGNSIGSYDLFNQWQGYSLFGNRFLFTGREWLPAIRLYDYRNRLYQPELGRFLQPDPKHFTGGDYNLYRYAHNDPVNRADPFGLQDYKPVGAFSRDGECETVRFTTWVSRPAIGSNLITAINWEVQRDQVNVDHVYKDGQPAAALTKADSQASGNSITWHITVQYNQLDFGARWREFARDKEHEHADAILAYAMSKPANIAAASALSAGRLDSAARNLLTNKMAHEEWLDRSTQRHTLKDRDGKTVPNNQ